MTFNPIRGCKHLITLLTPHYIRCYSHSIPPELLDRDLDQLVSQFKFLFTFKRSRMFSNAPFPYSWFLNRGTINFYNNNLKSTQKLRRISTWIAMGTTHGPNESNKRRNPERVQQPDSHYLSPINLNLSRMHPDQHQCVIAGYRPFHFTYDYSIVKISRVSSYREMRMRRVFSAMEISLILRISPFVLIPLISGGHDPSRPLM